MFGCRTVRSDSCDFDRFFFFGYIRMHWKASLIFYYMTTFSFWGDVDRFSRRRAVVLEVIDLFKCLGLNNSPLFLSIFIYNSTMRPKIGRRTRSNFLSFSFFIDSLTYLCILAASSSMTCLLKTTWGFRDLRLRHSSSAFFWLLWRMLYCTSSLRRSLTKHLVWSTALFN